jgi:predicted acyltransferase
LGRSEARGCAKPACLIFLIGFLLNLIPYFDVEQVRIPGVLQRIALCTLLAAPIVVYCGWRRQVAIMALLLTVYSACMLFYPVPGAGLLLLWLGAMSDAILMPINQSLWTPSYCFLMTGWALLIFSAFFWLLDVNPYGAVREAAARWTTPFRIYGMNALFIFAFSGLVAKMFGFIKFAQPDGSSVSLGRMLYALLFNACMFALAWAMWRRQWFVKV